MKRHTTRNKVLKCILTGSVFLSTFSAVAFTSKGLLPARAKNDASADSMISIDGIQIDTNQTLTRNADGTFDLDIDVSSFFTIRDLSVKETQTKYGYFEVIQDGTYLLESWGGDGGNGQDTLYSKGGKGGKGGYVYGAMNLQAGDFIFYTIGGNGQKTISSDTGGGANGDGGDHGDNGSYYVGGGGGYTAMYYFKKGTDATNFKANYLDSNGNLIRTTTLEADRISKYIMIAGAGGGGGAGNAFSLEKATRTADGGDAGSITSPSIPVSASASFLAGRYFPGQDGYSSGKKQDYVGRGATNVPGEVNSTYVGWFNGKQPNDWLGVQNANYPGGSGGSGNLRGGAGGAGYAGGSGGIMTDLLIGTNVGGGGGGSSFIASIVSDLNESQKQYLVGQNSSTSGGEIAITYVADEGCDYMDNITIEGEFTKYFDVKNSSTTEGLMTWDASHRSFKVTGAKAFPGVQGKEKSSTKLHFTLTIVNGFMGGNDVPLFKNNKLSVTAPNCADDPNSKNVILKDSCCYVNVPFAFELKTQSIISSSSPATGSLSSLFIDNQYVEAKANNDPNYDFIKKIDDYEIHYNGGTHGKTENYSVSETTTFDISFTVYPYEGSKATVGTRLYDKEYSSKAYVKINLGNVITLNGIDFTYNQNISYIEDTNQYKYTINLKGALPDDSAPGLAPTKTSGSYTVPTDGFYLLQAWGGNGGSGGNAAVGLLVEGPGSGGTGGSISKWVYLEQGTVLTYTIGSDGASGSAASITNWYSGGGKGGNPTSITIGGTEILGAGGGGGGTGTKSNQSNVHDGESVTITNTTGTATAGTQPNSGSGNTGTGAAGVNHYDATIMEIAHSDISPTPEQINAATKSYTHNGSGAVAITRIQVGPTSKDLLKDFTISANSSVYFAITGSSFDRANGNNDAHDDSITISNITPNYTTVEGFVTIDFNVNILFKPSEGFLGGNDVPLFETMGDITISQIDKDEINNDSAKLSENELTDYVNVNVPSDISDYINLIINDIDYKVGEAGIPASDLYNSSSYIDSDFYSLTWENDFVTPTLAVEDGDGPFTPSETTSYIISAGIVPTSNPTKAIVVPAANGTYISKEATINSYYVIDMAGSNLSLDLEKSEVGGEDAYVINPDEDLVTKILPEVGYALPDDITIEVDGEALTPGEDYTYDPSTGELVIFKENLTGKVTITANGKVVKYKIIYTPAIDVIGNPVPEVADNKYYYSSIELEAGTTGTTLDNAIDNLIAQYPTASVPSIDGYTYKVVWPDGERITVMPAYNVWINGSYVPNEHTLTIEYINESGETLAPKYINTQAYYNWNYAIPSPAVQGYVPNNVEGRPAMNAAVVNGTMGNADEDYIVVYKSTNAQLAVTYILYNGKSCRDTDFFPYEIGTPYLYEVIPYTDPDDGTDYLPDITVIEGVMVPEGVAYNVTYYPVKHTITFDSNGGTSVASRFAYNGHEIGYTGDDMSFVTLPAPYKEGCVFKGWLVEGTTVDDGYVTDETLFNFDDDITLVADWEEQSYIIRIKLSSDDGGLVFTDADDIVITRKPGQTYSSSDLDEAIVSGLIDYTGYFTPTFSGTMGTSPILLTVVYERKIATITVDTTPIVLQYGQKIELPVATAKFDAPISISTPGDLGKTLGDFEIVYTVNTTADYDGDTKTVAISIIQATSLPENVDYNLDEIDHKPYKEPGEGFTLPEISDLPDGVTLDSTKFYIKDSSDQWVETDTIEDAGEYRVDYTFVSVDERFASPLVVSKYFTIDPNTSLPDGVSFDPADESNKPYKGEAYPRPKVDGLPDDIEYIGCKITNADGNVYEELKDAKEYIITYYFKSDNPNYDPEPVVVSFTITPSSNLPEDVSFLPNGDDPKPYDGEPFDTPDVDEDSLPDGVTFTGATVYKENSDGGYDLYTGDIVDAGHYKIVYHFTSNNPNYKDSFDIEKFVDILPSKELPTDITFSPEEGEEETYTGEILPDPTFDGELPSGVTYLGYDLYLNDVLLEGDDKVVKLVGEYKVVHHFASTNPNYESTFDIVKTFTVSQSDTLPEDVIFLPEIEDPQEYTGDDFGQPGVDEGSLPEGVTFDEDNTKVYYFNVELGDYEEVSEIKKAGHYKVIYHFTATEESGYVSDFYEEREFDILPSTTLPDVELIPEIPDDQEYTGEDFPLPGINPETPLPEGVKLVGYEITRNGEVVDHIKEAGDYVVTYYFTSENPDYENPIVITKSFTISKTENLPEDVELLPIVDEPETYTGESFGEPGVDEEKLPEGVTLYSVVVEYKLNEIDDYEVSTDPIEAAGYYHIIYTFHSENENYPEEFVKERYFVISASESLPEDVSILPVIPEGGEEFNEDGIPEPTVDEESLPEGVTFEKYELYKLVDEDYEIIDVAKDVGHYKIIYYFHSENPNYLEDFTKTIEFDILPSTSLPEETDFNEDEIDGTEYKEEEIPLPEVTGLPEGVEIDWNNTKIYKDGELVDEVKDAGDYTVIYAFTSENPNYDPEDVIIEFTIIKAPNEILEELDTIYAIYDEAILLPSSECTVGGIANIQYASGDLVNVGEYNVYYVSPETENYKSTSKCLIVIITPATTLKNVDYHIDEVNNKIFNNVEFDPYNVSNLPNGVSVSDVTIMLDGSAVNKVNNAGSYVLTYVFSSTNDNYEVNDVTKSFVIRKADYDMSNVKYESTSFKYDGLEHNIIISEDLLPTGLDGVKLSATYSEAKIEVGKYEAVVTFATTSSNYNLPEARKVTLTINNANISDSHGSVFMDTDNGFDPNVLVTSNEISAETAANNLTDAEKQFIKNNDIVGPSVDITLYNGNKEIQPSDLGDGTVITVRIRIPTSIVGTNFKILHIHSEDDVSVIVKGEEPGVGTFVIDEEGYIVTQINKLSQFKFVYENDCFIHWILLGFLVVILALFAVSWFVLKKRKFTTMTTIGYSALLVGLVVTTCFMKCSLCVVFVAVDFTIMGLIGIIYLVNTILKKSGGNGGQTIIKEVYVKQGEIPADAAVIASEPKVEAKEEVSEELTLHDQMEKAAAIVASSDFVVTKENVANYLANNYGDGVVINRKPNYTKTNLPLPDTHYIKGEKNVCFLYVYELKENKNAFLIGKTNEDIVKQIKEKHPLVNVSLFPHTNDGGKWFSIMFDDSYKSMDDVHEVIDLLISCYLLKKETISAPIEGLTLKESISKASLISGANDVNKMSVINYLNANHSDVVITKHTVNYTSTNLPLPDTHYIKGEKNKCFLYVYELDEGKNVFLVVKTPDSVINSLKNKHPGIISSKFPHTNDGGKWYTILLDDSYKGENDVYALLKEVIEAYCGTPKEQPIEEEKELSLHDSITKAATVSTEFKVNKEIVANYLSENYKVDVTVNRKANYTSTNLPLPDTHYVKVDEKNKCFLYVYELNEGKNVFLVVKTESNIVKELKAKHSLISPSAFPHTNDGGKWFTVMFDDSFKNVNDVYEIIDKVLSGYLKNSPISAIEEPIEEGLSLKESISKASKNNEVLTEKINKNAVISYLEANHSDVVITKHTANYTSTNLPLPDTHYIKGEKNKCFLYVYELDEGKNVFLVVKAPDSVIGSLKKKHPSIVASKFPHTNDGGKWYTVILDSSYNGEDSLFNLLREVIEAYSGKKNTTESEPVEEKELSLHDTMSKAASVVKKEEIKINKDVVASYLEANYKESIIVNRKANYTSTNLPLPDTHYIKGEKNKCFLYVYELNEGKNVFLVAKTNEEIYKQIKTNHPLTAPSAFPHTNDGGKWYSIMFDDSYKSNKDIEDVIELVIKGYSIKKL